MVKRHENKNSFHITLENEVKPCVATDDKKCRYTTHFSSLSDGLDYVEKTFFKSSFKSGLPSRRVFHGSRVLLESPVGSRLYGLKTPQSDNDRLIILDSLSNFSTQTIDKTTNEDVRIVGAEFFAKQVIESRTVEVDVLLSRHFKPEGSLAPYLRSLRFSEYAYIRESESKALEILSTSLEDGRINTKKIKLASRLMALGIRMSEVGQREFEPYFDSRAFYTALSHVENDLKALSQLDRDDRIRKSFHLLYDAFGDYKNFMLK